MEIKSPMAKKILRIMLLVFLTCTALYGILCFLLLGNYDFLTQFYRQFRLEQELQECKRNAMVHIKVRQALDSILTVYSTMIRKQEIEKTRLLENDPHRCGCVAEKIPNTSGCIIGRDTIIKEFARLGAVCSLHAFDSYDVYGYLDILNTNKNRPDKDMGLRIFDRDVQSDQENAMTQYTHCDTICLGYDIIFNRLQKVDRQLKGTIYWSCLSREGIITGCNSVINQSMWNYQQMPLQEGNNWITMVYTEDWNAVAFDHILVSKYSQVIIDNVTLVPDVFYIDSLTEYTVSARVIAKSIHEVSLQQYDGQTEHTIALFQDNGKNGDAHARDSVFTARFIYKPIEDVAFIFRIKAVTHRQTAYSGIFSYDPIAPYRDWYYTDMMTTGNEAGSLYKKLKESGLDPYKARDSVVVWLSTQPCVQYVAPNIGSVPTIGIIFKPGIWVLYELEKDTIHKPSLIRRKKKSPVK
jgi:hypothetical protein